MIEDLDAIEPAPLESQRTPTKICSCGETNARRERASFLRVRSTEVTWSTSSFLSPDEAIWDLRRRTSEGTEFRWELHTSTTDLDLVRKTKCSCHSLIPGQKKPEGVHRGDLRKHHSAETDKWSVRPENLLTPMHDLRKHSSDDTRFAREARWLQVPDVMPNPKPRCTCPKVKTPPPASPVEVKPELKEPEKPIMQKEEKKLYYSKSLTPEEPAVLWEKPEVKRQASEDPRAARGKPRDRPKLERSAQVRSESSRRWGFSQRDKDKDKEKEKEKVISPVESKKPIRARWAMKPHVSLPAEKKAPKWYRSQDETKSKSLRERPKYSIRRSMSPEPDPRQMNKLENRIVRRLISPEISITSTKWAPYEDSSPLPTIGIRKREKQKHISDIKWTPYDESPSEIPVEVIDDKKWSPFQNVTPTHCPPPEPATPSKSDDEEFRWKILNMVAPFPLYQGGWKDESPEKTPPKKATTPDDLSTPIWSPREPTTPTAKRKSFVQPDYSPEYSPAARRSSKPRLIRKGAIRVKASLPTTSPLEDRLPQAGPPPPTVIIRAASEETKRQRPQLTRSKALLEVPKHIDATKRSLSEEGPRMHPRERPKPPGRTRSEEVSKYDDPWLKAESSELPTRRERASRDRERLDYPRKGLMKR
ncbi:PREDICTED: pollen-specific leucine-rich repeat extensin-like protein 1 [Atta cephalotes]|uniref:Uncharacterized protein n=1 Tax=Atta cephalotes TaxID=12957 RepID=A0A158P1T1_ATTCE|nr:PREDICTED: pollen-specific leucine-rich repeat extensin-like protein 1 [Atta cephalotes]